MPSPIESSLKPPDVEEWVDLKYYSLLVTNLRVAVMFASILSDHVGLFFLF